jgi:hypothetical protein
LPVPPPSRLHPLLSAIEFEDSLLIIDSLVGFSYISITDQ